MRVSQFFPLIRAKSLVKMNEYYPDLMERIVRREPNAYLASLYIGTGNVWSEYCGTETETKRDTGKDEVRPARRAVFRYGGKI